MDTLEAQGIPVEVLAPDDVEARWPQVRADGLTGAVLEPEAGLLLARVDGKSPVEYLDENSRDLVRRISIPMIETPRTSLDSVIAAVHPA